MANPYRHEPLSPAPSQAIRLLRILPDEGDAMIRIETSQCHFAIDSYDAEKPYVAIGSNDLETSYVALSYAWGSSSPLSSILVNNQPFEIRENLWQFFRQLQSSGETRLLWADAICINQEDVNEKNAQVSMMGQIFNTADEVRVWLGEAAEGSDSMLDLANKMDWDNSPTTSIVPPQFSSAAPIFLEFYHLQRLAALCQRDYWTRTWIIQEISLARSRVLLCCGSKETTFPKMRSFCDYVVASNEARGVNRTASEDYVVGGKKTTYLRLVSESTLRKLFRVRPGSCEVRMLLKVYRTSLCQDPRDKVYAFMSMASDLRLDVDYDTDVRQLYWDVLAICRAKGLRFARMLQKSLGLSTESLRERPDFAAISYSMYSIANKLNRSLRPLELPSTALKPIGIVVDCHGLGCEPNKEELSSPYYYVEWVRTSQEFSSQKKSFTSRRNAEKRNSCSAISGNAVNADDILCVFVDFPKVALVLRWSTAPYRISTTLLKDKLPWSADEREIISLALVTEFEDDSRLCDWRFEQRLSWLSTPTGNLKLEPTPGLRLTLNPTVIMAFSEVFDFTSWSS